MELLIALPFILIVLVLMYFVNKELNTPTPEAHHNSFSVKDTDDKKERATTEDR
jgi:choline-glycine betaine transporter